MGAIVGEAETRGAERDSPPDPVPPRHFAPPVPLAPRAARFLTLFQMAALLAIVAAVPIGIGPAMTIAVPFVLAVLFTVFVGRLRPRWKRRQPADPSVPGGWTREGTRRSLLDTEFERMRVHWAVAFAVLCALGVIAAGTRGTGRSVTLLLAGFLVAAAMFRLVWVASRGKFEVSFPRYPFRTGEPVDLHVRMSEGGAPLRDVVLHLRRMTTSPGSGNLLATECAYWTALRPATDLRPGDDVRVTFHPPAELGGAELDAECPAWWELVFEGRIHGERICDRVLLPILDDAPQPIAA